MDKKKEQLGMNPSTANGRLLKDLLFDFAVKAGHVCYRCKKPLDRETFSIEHMEPWLDSEDPIKLFFDLENIGYSHLPCNVAASRKILADHGQIGMYNRGCHCQPCRDAKSACRRKAYTPEKRREIYLKTGY